MTEIQYRIRIASLEDAGRIQTLIELSTRSLGSHFYSPAQIVGTLRGTCGIDTQLTRDGTYFVVEAGGVLVGCGGWSFRNTLFGGDAAAIREPETIDPETGAARIRAYFVHPDWVRRGIGSLILLKCEDEARASGYSQLALMSTLSGLDFYLARGFKSGKSIEHPIGNPESPGLTIQLVPMEKELI